MCEIVHVQFSPLMHDQAWWWWFFQEGKKIPTAVFAHKKPRRRKVGKWLLTDSRNRVRGRRRKEKALTFFAFSLAWPACCVWLRCHRRHPRFRTQNTKKEEKAAETAFFRGNVTGTAQFFSFFDERFMGMISTYALGQKKGGEGEIAFGSKDSSSFPTL